MKLYLRSCFIFALLLVIWVPTATAALQCNDCHGTSKPADLRPLDASFRNPSGGGFPGNHRTHLDAPSTSSACNICHPDSSSYDASHRDGKIKISSHANNSPNITYYPAYNNNTTAWAQTATPTLGTCSNVNCHFETVTPVWGESPTLTSCTTCHGVPPDGTPADYSGGAAGSHRHHDAYYPGVDNCIKCHSDHTTEPAPFAHATSIGKRAIYVQPRDPQNNIYGSFSAGTNDYLPSQVGSHTYGTCKSTYCHSTVQADGGTGQPVYGSPKWGTPSDSCNLSCHRVGFHNSVAADGSPVNSRINTGSHTKHLAYPTNSVGSCSSCHLWTPSYLNGGCMGASCHPGPHGGGPLVPPETYTKHANGMIDISFNPGYAASATYNAIATPMSKAPRTGYSACSNVYCHSNGTSVATGTVPDNTSPAWGTGTMTCSGCHGNPPAYNNGSPKANSHAKHAGLGYGCNACHAGTTTNGTTIDSTTLHVNKSYDLSPGTGITFTYVFAVTGGTCSNISCHNNGTAVWGATLTCGDCHAVSPGGD